MTRRKRDALVEMTLHLKHVFYSVTCASQGYPRHRLPCSLPSTNHRGNTRSRQQTRCTASSCCCPPPGDRSRCCHQSGVGSSHPTTSQCACWTRELVFRAHHESTGKRPSSRNTIVPSEFRFHLQRISASARDTRFFSASSAISSSSEYLFLSNGFDTIPNAAGRRSRYVYPVRKYALPCTFSGSVAELLHTL